MTPTVIQRSIPNLDTFTYSLPTQKNPFIFEQRGALTKSFCKNVIKKFKQDNNRYPGCTFEGVDRNLKASTDLNISVYNEGWEEEDDVFFKSLEAGLPAYHKFINEGVKLTNFHKLGSTPVRVGWAATDDCEDAGYQVQETKPGDYYDWHNDFAFEPYTGNNQDLSSTTRALTYLWYLNDVNSGGETEFYDGTLVKPEAGKLIIFPATWTFYHRGRPPKRTNKYITTGWLKYIR